MQYDAELIEKWATSLKNKADAIVFSEVIKCGLVGWTVGLAVPYLTSGPIEDLPWKLIVCSIGLAIGLQIGLEKSLAIKIEAQKLLCQMQIEINTRGSQAAPPSSDVLNKLRAIKF